tara:strand:- start:936 stop:1421 length:486 start_codon:yes stop_codon:yes gene_type:complete
MCKIKLSTLLLISFFLVSCSAQKKYNTSNTFNLGRIESDVEGLVAHNILSSHLNSFGLLNGLSHYKISGKINHATSLYITNIDNTSDRENVITTLYITIVKDACVVYKYEEETSQFYLITSSTKFKSNTKAIEKIKYDNSENLIQRFINIIIDKPLNCIDE